MNITYWPHREREAIVVIVVIVVIHVGVSAAYKERKAYNYYSTVTVDCATKQERKACIVPKTRDSAFIKEREAEK